MKEVLREYGRTLAGAIAMTLLLLALRLPMGELMTSPLRQKSAIAEQASSRQDELVDREMRQLQLEIHQLRDNLICGEEITMEDLVEAKRSDGSEVSLRILGLRYRNGVQAEWQALSPDSLMISERRICPQDGGIYQLLLQTIQGPKEEFVITFAANRKPAASRDRGLLDEPSEESIE